MEGLATVCLNVLYCVKLVVKQAKMAKLDELCTTI